MSGRDRILEWAAGLTRSREAEVLPTLQAVESDVGVLLFPTSDLVMRPFIESTGDWDLDESTLFTAHIEQGMTVLDVGANVGYYTLLAAQAVGSDGHVVAVEPDPLNTALLRENIARAGLTNVEIIAAAAWRDSAKLRLRRNPDNAGDSRVGRGRGAGRSVKVDAVALDDVLGVEAVVHAVKIDAQGTDHVAVQGMERLLRRMHPIVFVEFWPEAIRSIGDEPTAVIEYYRSLGFRLTMPGVQANFADWPSQEFVSIAECLPGGFATIVLRGPSQQRPNPPQRATAEA
jgi:FkbM family methyltransferase